MSVVQNNSEVPFSHGNSGTTQSRVTDQEQHHGWNTATCKKSPCYHRSKTRYLLAGFRQSHGVASPIQPYTCLLLWPWCTLYLWNIDCSNLRALIIGGTLTSKKGTQQVSTHTNEIKKISNHRQSTVERALKTPKGSNVKLKFPEHTSSLPLAVAKQQATEDKVNYTVYGPTQNRW